MVIQPSRQLYGKHRVVIKSSSCLVDQFQSSPFRLFLPANLVSAQGTCIIMNSRYIQPSIATHGADYFDYFVWQFSLVTPAICKHFSARIHQKWYLPNASGMQTLTEAKGPVNNLGSRGSRPDILVERGRRWE